MLTISYELMAISFKYREKEGLKDNEKGKLNFNFNLSPRQEMLAVMLIDT